MAGDKDTAIGNKQLADSLRKESNRKSKAKTRKRPRTRQAKARRRGRRSVDCDRVTTFPEVKGKVVREVRFTHDNPENVLAIAFKDRTVLIFEVDPEPLVMPVDIRAHYIGDHRSADRSWERLQPQRAKTARAGGLGKANRN